MFRVEARTHATGALVRQLAAPVRFSFDYRGIDPWDWGRAYPTLFTYDETLLRWVPVPGARTDLAAQRVEADVGHFTDFAFGGDGGTMPTTPPNLEGYQVDLGTGQASASIPLAVPPGPNGRQPQLTLSYSSGVLDNMNQNWLESGGGRTHGDPVTWDLDSDPDNCGSSTQASVVGLGWSLETPAVYRVNRRVQYQDTWHEVFSLSLNGRSYELLWVSGDAAFDRWGTYVSKPDEFLRIRRLNTEDPARNNYNIEHFLVETGDGTRYRFGWLDNARARAGAGQYGAGPEDYAVWRFGLDQVTDTYGNLISYEYLNVPASALNAGSYTQAVHPSRIVYGTNSSLAGLEPREVRFTYVADRTDIRSTSAHVNNSQYYLTHRLTTVETFVGASRVRTYSFTTSYGTPWWHHISSYQPTGQQKAGYPKLLLTGLTTTGYDASGAALALPATSFSYHSGPIPNTTEYYRLPLQAVQNGHGGSVSYTYGGHDSVEHQPTPLPTDYTYMPRRFRVVTRTVSPGTGTAGAFDATISHTYHYGAAHVWQGNGGPELFGHDWVAVFDARGNRDYSYFYTNNTALKSRRYRRERWTPGMGALLETEETDWQAVDRLGASWHVRQTAVRTLRPGAATRQRTFAYDPYGNVQVTRAYDNGSLVRTRLTEYVPSTGVSDGGHYIVGALAREVSYAPGSSTAYGDWLAETWHGYDGATSYQTPIATWGRGARTATRRLLNGGLCVDSVSAYNSLGLVTSRTEYNSYGTPGGALAAGDARTLYVSYEPTYQMFPGSITNALSHQEQRRYHARWGTLAQATEPNGGVRDYTYDPLGRLTDAFGPTVSGYRATVHHDYSAPQTVDGRWVTQIASRARSDAGGTEQWQWTWRFYDAIGRQIQEQRPAASGIWVTNTYYDSRGLVGRVTVPHLVSGSGGTFQASDWTAWASSSQPGTETTSDGLGRPTDVRHPNGTSSRTRYDGWATDTIDANGHKRRHAEVYDAASGRQQVRITEYSGTYTGGEAPGSGTVYATTTYAQDALERLVAVTDAAGNQTRLTYDALGRKIALADPDMGIWWYGYDAQGNLTSQTDALGQRLGFAYDRLNRLVRTGRVQAGARTWTQPTISAGATVIRLPDMVELRTAIDEDRVAANLGAAAWTDPVLTAGGPVRVRAVHVTEPRAHLQALWDLATLGAVPGFTGGAVVGDGTRVIKASDMTDLRTWLQQYESSSYGQSHQGMQELASFAYDAYDPASGQYGRGQRTGMTDGLGQHTFTWDVAGRQTAERRTLDGTVYQTQSSFDALGRVRQTVLPSGETLSYAYGTEGLLSSLSSTLQGSTTLLLNGVQYSPDKLPLQYDLGGNSSSGRVQQRYYGVDGEALDGSSPYGALKRTTWGSLLERTLGYDAVGNITSLTDATNSESFNYGYDERDRLLSVSGALSESYAYDAIGNLTSKGGQSLSYPSSGQPRPHAVTAHNGSTYAYDANGSLTSRTTGSTTRTFSYDLQRRPTQVSEGGTRLATFSYDGDGTRRKRTDSTGTVHYVSRDYERRLADGLGPESITTYYRALGRLIALKKDGQLRWVGTDHLGSTARVTDSSFMPLDQQRYTPYGSRRNSPPDGLDPIPVG